jgi:hypothetical protein
MANGTKKKSSLDLLLGQDYVARWLAENAEPIAEELGPGRSLQEQPAPSQPGAGHLRGGLTTIETGSGVPGAAVATSQHPDIDDVVSGRAAGGPSTAEERFHSSGLSVPVKTKGTAARKPIGIDVLSGIEEEAAAKAHVETDAWARQQRALALRTASARRAAADAGYDRLQPMIIEAEDREREQRGLAMKAAQTADLAGLKSNLSKRIADKAARTGVDPRKYWDKMPAFERVKKSLAIAFEAIGKGMIALGGGKPEAGSQVLKMIDAAVNADIAAQRENIRVLLERAGADAKTQLLADKNYSRLEAQARESMQDRIRLELVQQAYDEQEPETRNFILGVANDVGKTRINVALKTAPKFKRTRKVYAGKGLGSMSRAKRYSRGVSTSDVKKAAQAGAPNPLTHERLPGGKWRKWPAGWRKASNSVDEKGTPYVTTGSFSVGGRTFSYGFPGRKMTDMKQLPEHLTKGMYGATNVLKEMSRLVKQNNVGNRTWSPKKKMISWLSPGSKEAFHRIYRSAVAVRQAVIDSGGRATDLENKIIKALQVSEADSEPMAMRKLAVGLRKAEAALRDRLTGVNFQTHDPHAVIGLALEMRRLRSLISVGAGGKAKKLTSLERD